MNVERSRVGSHFTVELGKMLDAARDDGSNPLPYLRNANVQWDLIDVIDVKDVTLTREECRRLRLRRGDLLVCEGGDIGRAAVWNDQLPECYYQKALLRLRPRRNASPRYLMYALWAAKVSGEIGMLGGTSTIQHLTGEQLRRLRLPFPAPADQTKIVAFLDRETKAIDHLIAMRERQASLLDEELRREIARLALGDDRPRVPLGLIARTGSGTTPPADESTWFGGNVPWVTTREIQDGRVDRTARSLSTEAIEAFSALRIYPPGTVLMSMYMTGSAGRVGMLDINAATNQAICAIAFDRREIDPGYGFWALRGMRAEIQAMVSGGAQGNISQQDVRSLRIPLLPLSLQRDIADALFRHSARLADTMDLLTRSTNLLKELRQSLISAAVEGRWDEIGRLDERDLETVLK